MASRRRRTGLRRWRRNDRRFFTAATPTTNTPPRTFGAHSTPGVSAASEVSASFQLRRDDGSGGLPQRRGIVPEQHAGRRHRLQYILWLILPGVMPRSIGTSTRCPSPCSPGNNILAVEIHQFSPTSSDISFDLTLSAYAPLEQVFSMENPLVRCADREHGICRALRAHGRVLVARIHRLRFDLNGSLFSLPSLPERARSCPT